MTQLSSKAAVSQRLLPGGTANTRRPRLRFGLRSLTVAVTLLCALLGYHGLRLASARHQRATVDRLRQAGAHVDYVKRESEFSGWQIRLFGHDYLCGVEGVLISETDEPNRLIVMASELEPLERIRIEHCKLNEESLAPLASRTELEWLSLCGTNANDQQLTMLSNMLKLRILDLRRTNITDESVDILVRLRNLELLLVGDTGITKAAVARLSEVLPNCDVNNPRYD